MSTDEASKVTPGNRLRPSDDDLAEARNELLATLDEIRETIGVSADAERCRHEKQRVVLRQLCRVDDELAVRRSR